MSKYQLTRDLTAQRDALLEIAAALTADERALRLGNSEWGAKDILGHLAYWERITLNHIHETLSEGKPRPMPADSLDDDINMREVARRRAGSWERVRSEFEAARNTLISRVDTLTDGQLALIVPSPWLNDERFLGLEQLIREDVIEHAQSHLDDVITQNSGELA